MKVFILVNETLPSVVYQAFSSERSAIAAMRSNGIKNDPDNGLYEGHIIALEVDGEASDEIEYSMFK